MERAQIDSENLLYCEASYFRIVAKLRNHLRIPFTNSEVINTFLSKDDILPWTRLRKAFPQIRINNLFTSLNRFEISSLVNQAMLLDKKYKPPNFFAYFIIDCPGEINPDLLWQNLLDCKNVETAYLVSNSKYADPKVGTNQVADLSQGYLNPAPEGIDALYAGSILGGDGSGNVKFIDIEQGWILNHESVSVNTLPCTGLNHATHDHGTAVLGVIMMKSKNGATGITPKAQGYVISQWRHDGCRNNADAIMAVLSNLHFGDVMLIETQVRDSPSTKYFWPVEIQDATYQAIRLAHALGIIVIEAAGNGGIAFSLGHHLDVLHLDDRYIFDRSSPDFRDSGAIFVAAATSTPPHKRIYKSNYGNRIDCYAWGQHVATAGSFPQSSGGASDTYTINFGDTSSAAAIIAGAAISVQSIVEANYRIRLSPLEMRAILSNELNGTPSANGNSVDKIGVMPDLKKIIDSALPKIVGLSVKNGQMIAQ